MKKEKNEGVKAKTEIIVTEPDTIQKLYRIGAIPNIVESVVVPPVLAAYLAERGVIGNAEDAKRIISEQMKKDPLAEDKFAVVRHLWSKGYVCRMSNEVGGADGSDAGSGDAPAFDFIRVHQKGLRAGEDRTKYAVLVIPREWNADLKKINELFEASGKLRKELILAYVRQDGAVKFVRMGRATFE